VINAIDVQVTIEALTVAAGLLKDLIDGLPEGRCAT